MVAAARQGAGLGYDIAASEAEAIRKAEAMNSFMAAGALNAQRTAQDPTIWPTYHEHYAQQAGMGATAEGWQTMQKMTLSQDNAAMPGQPYVYVVPPMAEAH